MYFDKHFTLITLYAVIYIEYYIYCKQVLPHQFTHSHTHAQYVM